jgi:hypothetical protein
MKLASSAFLLGAALTVTSLSQAQPPETYPPPAPVAPAQGEVPVAKRPLGAPSNALELSVSTGYTQGFGNLKSGVGLPSVATVGIGFDLGVGYRIDPNWAVLWNGQYQEFTAERVAHARGITNDIAVQYHFAPMRQVDPWIEGGAGYRVFWEDPDVGATLTTHGFQLARVRAGLDLRADEYVAIGPIIGADATLFLFQDVPNLGTSISDPRLSTFVYAGLQGRFDVGGKTVSPGSPTVAGR